MSTNTVPVLWLQVVKRVVKSLVESALPQRTEKVEGKCAPQKIEYPVKKQIKGHPVIPDSVQDPGSPPSAQVKLGREGMAVCQYAGTLAIFFIILLCKRSIYKADLR